MSEAPTPNAKTYNRIKLIVGLVTTGLFLLYALGWVLWGGEALVGWTDSRWLGLLIFGGSFSGAFALLTLPLDYYTDFVLEHRYDLSHQTLGRFVTQTLKGWAVGAILGGVLLCGLYALLWHGGQWWWLWVWLAWIGTTVVLAQLFPVLLLPIFHKSSPLEDLELGERLKSIASNTSLRIDGVFNLDLSTDTRAANAMLTGLGRTRRVYLSDTLLESFTAPEIEVVFAHELGHHTRRHIWKQLLMSAGLVSVLIAALVVLLDPMRGTAAPWREAVLRLPVVSLVVTFLQMVMTPLHNAVSRRFERQCDRDALARTADPEAYRSAFQRLGDMNLADPDPHPFVEWYFHDHPALSKRIAAADDWAPPEQRNATEAAPHCV